MIVRRAAVLLGICCAGLLAQNCPGDPQPPRLRSAYNEYFKDRVDRIFGFESSPTANLSICIEEQVDVRSGELVMGAFIYYSRARSLQTTFDYLPVVDARNDKQIGAAVSTSGSTSLVSKGSVPSFLGFAVENGALTEAVSGTTATFRGNLIGVLDLTRNQGFLESYDDDSKLVRQLRRVSYSFSLDTGRTAAAPSETSSRLSLDAIRSQVKQTSQQLANYSVRIAIWDQRDPRTETNRAAITHFMDTQGVRLLTGNNFLNSFLNSDEYLQLRERTVDLLRAEVMAGSPRATIDRVFRRQMEETRLLALRRIPNFEQEIEKYVGVIESFDRANTTVYEEMRKKPVAAFEYVNTRLAALPDTSTFRFILEGKFPRTRLDLTSNVAFTLQNSGTVLTPEPKKLGGFRDFQAAAQGEVPLGNRAKGLSPGLGLGNPLLSFAYLSRRLSEKSTVTFAGFNYNVDPGWIHVAQAKLVLPVKGSGLKIPLSFSVASRTELIHEKDVRAHLGITFDFDSIAAGFLKK